MKQGASKDKLMLETKLMKIDNIQKKIFELQKRYYELPPEADLTETDEAIGKMEEIEADKIRLANDNLILQGTKLEYVASGKLPTEVTSSNYCCCVAVETNLDNAIKELFEIESFPKDSFDSTKSEEEKFCEEHFLKTHGTTDYVDLIDWQACQVTPPPVLRQISSHELLKMIQDDVQMDGWDFIKFPSHTQAVERIGTLVTEASRKRVEPQNRDGFIRATLES
ncbi:hypothetical protein AVEN_2557-1 [Araneus ventricosus]|uniref:Uncharacterized protein n=1 Tax=Araneus ventricosus TaxID=182803 RepID=A0A4Y2GSX2_ARAVE|nr:hypothetical protein AVEN_2557-1 [Araneus ventricosus]